MERIADLRSGSWGSSRLNVAPFVFREYDVHPHDDIPETPFLGCPHSWMGPISTGIGQFLDWDAVHGSIMLAGCLPKSTLKPC
jgi:hypothetical protein